MIIFKICIWHFFHCLISLEKEKFVLTYVKQIMIATMEENNVINMENVSLAALRINIVHLDYNAQTRNAQVHIIIITIIFLY